MIKKWRNERCKDAERFRYANHRIIWSGKNREPKVRGELSLRSLWAALNAQRNQIMNKIMLAALIRFQYHLPFIGVPQLRPNNETIFYFLRWANTMCSGIGFPLSLIWICMHDFTCAISRLHPSIRADALPGNVFIVVPIDWSRTRISISVEGWTPPLRTRSHSPPRWRIERVFYRIKISLRTFFSARRSPRPRAGSVRMHQLTRDLYQKVEDAWQMDANREQY